ncbi:MAG: putative rRNA maturation factor [Candidatus Azotimanducaceae bacterium]|jgi:probable rRNA maturation factor
MVYYVYMERFSISSTVKEYPQLPYEAIKNDILGKTFELSLVFIGPARAKKLNESTRGKTYIPNVLAFPLTETNGEIFIAPTTAEAECKRYKLSPKGYIGFLYIHGLLHLKGFTHGPKMERLEQRFLERFKLS